MVAVGFRARQLFGRSSQSDFYDVQLVLGLFDVRQWWYSVDYREQRDFRHHSHVVSRYPSSHPLPAV